MANAFPMELLNEIIWYGTRVCVYEREREREREATTENWFSRGLNETNKCIISM